MELGSRGAVKAGRGRKLDEVVSFSFFFFFRGRVEKTFSVAFVSDAPLYSFLFFFFLGRFFCSDAQRGMWNCTVDFSKLWAFRERAMEPFFFF